MPERFEDAIKALRHIARGNGSVMRIADRIVAAHEREIAATKLAAEMPTYDVEGNERHKAACELRDMKIGKLSTHWNFVCSLAARLNIPRPNDEPYEDYELHELIRDKLVNLLEGECNFSTPESYMACEDGDPNPAETLSDEQESVTLGTRSPITGELRERIEQAEQIIALGYETQDMQVRMNRAWLMEKLDAIDSVHAQLERENDELRVKFVNANRHALHMGRENESLKAELDRVLGEQEGAIMPPLLDMDDKPIHFGDVMVMDGDSELREVVGFYDVGFLAWRNGRFVPCAASLYRHAKPDTWESVIYDAMQAGRTDATVDVTPLIERCRALAGDAR